MRDTYSLRVGIYYRKGRHTLLSVWCAKGTTMLGPRFDADEYAETIRAIIYDRDNAAFYRDRMHTAEKSSEQWYAQGMMVRFEAYVDTHRADIKRMTSPF